MSETALAPSGAAPAGAASGGGALDSVRNALKGDVLFAVGIIGILALLILPTPSWLLDILLAASITFSVMVLMTALFMRKALEFSTFPAVLLIATMLRLGLNVASTRLILANGHNGGDAAGAVIEAFGSFVMQGNYVIGVIVFAILVIVNFVVITRGSSRIAEVAARFTLDAMPGKQMAVDADLSAGLITEEQARARRKELEAESNFFGAMDGASKFVRGDAVAGLLITLINIVGGIIIGVLQMRMSIGDAGASYTLLTIGDGLVSQIPALIISVAAGLLVSKAGVEGAAEQAFAAQFTGYPRALAVVCGVLIIIALLPGMPPLPFLLMASGAGAAAWYLRNGGAVAAEEAEVARKQAQVAEAQAAEASRREDDPADALQIDDLRIELGYGLLPLINDEVGRRLTDQIKALRKSIAQDFGFVTPSVRILDNVQLSSDSYVIRLKEANVGEGELRPMNELVINPAGGEIELVGDPTTEPAFGLPAMWVDEGLKEEAALRGYTVVDPATVLTTHLTEIIKNNMPDLLSYAETKKLVDGLGDRHRQLIDDLVPDVVSISTLKRVLQALLAERISIRDLPTIVEAIGEAASANQNIALVVEHVRMRLARQISASLVGPSGAAPIITLSPQWEQAFGEALVGQGDETQLAMAPSKLQDFVADVSRAMEQASVTGEAPAIVTSGRIRPYVRSVVERFRAQTPVISQNEIHPQARLDTLGQV